MKVFILFGSHDYESSKSKIVKVFLDEAKAKAMRERFVQWLACEPSITTHDFESPLYQEQLKDWQDWRQRAPEGLGYGSYYIDSQEVIE